MARNISIDCDLCGTSVPLEQGKEVLIKQGENDFHLMDLCVNCLDDQLKSAESVNDAKGFRQQAAAMITPKEGSGPQHRAAS